MADPQFLDTNVIARYVLGDNPVQSPKATAFFRQIEQGDVEVRITDTVILEVIYVLQRLYRVPRTDIRDAINGVLKFPGVRLANKQRVRQALDLYVSTPSLSWADSFHAILTLRLGLPGIVSFDRDFDRVPGLHRIEPT